MAYNGNDAAYYLEDDRGRMPPGHFAGNLYDNTGFHGYKHGHSGGSYKLKACNYLYRVTNIKRVLQRYHILSKLGNVNSRDLLYLWVEIIHSTKSLALRYLMIQ